MAGTVLPRPAKYAVEGRRASLQQRTHRENACAGDQAASTRQRTKKSRGTWTSQHQDRQAHEPQLVQSLSQARFIVFLGVS
eukprot:4320944-Amphidinium_carterae.1